MLSQLVEELRRAGRCEGVDMDGAQAEALTRAVLAALRTPSPRMLRALSRALSPKYRPTPEWMSTVEKNRTRWAAAIDEALGIKPVPRSDPCPDGRDDALLVGSAEL